jgi:hypothetical protein
MNGRIGLRSGLHSKELQIIQDELMSAEKCLEICDQFSDLISRIELPPEQSHNDGEFERQFSKAKAQRKENISIVDNYALGDAAQYMVSNFQNHTVHGRNRGLGWRTRHYGGYIDGPTLRTISAHHATVLPTRMTARESRRGKAPSNVDREEAEGGAEARVGRYRGRNIRLLTDVVVNKPTKPKGSISGKPSGSLRK